MGDDSWFTVGIQNSLSFFYLFLVCTKPAYQTYFNDLTSDYNPENSKRFHVFLAFLVYTESEYTITATPHIVKENMGKNNNFFAENPRKSWTLNF